MKNRLKTIKKKEKNRKGARKDEGKQNWGTQNIGKQRETVHKTPLEINIYKTQNYKNRLKTILKNEKKK